MSIIPIAEADAAPPEGFVEAKEGFLAREDGVTAGLVLIVLAEHLAFGGNRADISLAFVLVQALLLAYALSTPWGRKGLGGLDGWLTAAILFALGVLSLCGSLVHLPFGGNPVWLAVGRAPVAAINPLGVLIELAKLAGLACVFTLSAILAAERRRAIMFMKILVLAALGFGLACLILEGLSPVDVFGWAKPTISRYRVSGLFSSANTAATVFGMNGLLAAGGLMRGASRLHEKTAFGVITSLVKFFPVEIVAFFISAGCLLLTGSRGGVGAFALSFAALLIWRGRGGGGASRFSRGLLIAIAFALLAVSGGFAIERYFAAAYAEDARPIWAVLSFKLFQTAPLEGFGLGSFPLVLRALTSASNYGVVSWAGSAHNLYLQWLLEAGVLGSIPMAGLLVWLIWTAGDHMPTQGASAYWRPTLLVCVVMVLVHSFVEYSLQEPSIAAYFSLILGAAMGFASMRRGRGRRKTRVEARAAAAAVGAGDVGVAKTASDKTPSAA